MLNFLSYRFVYNISALTQTRSPEIEQSGCTKTRVVSINLLLEIGIALRPLREALKVGAIFRDGKWISVGTHEYTCDGI